MLTGKAGASAGGKHKRAERAPVQINRDRDALQSRKAIQRSFQMGLIDKRKDRAAARFLLEAAGERPSRGPAPAPHRGPGPPGSVTRPSRLPPLHRRRYK